MSENTERESILRRIKAMREKTVANGCTEQEAATAAEMVGKLLDQYGFSLSDIEFKDEQVTMNTMFGNGKKLGELIFCSLSITRYCDCKTWIEDIKTRGVTREALQVLGRESDCEVALYLLHLCYTALESEWETYRRTLPRSRATSTQDQWDYSNDLAKKRRDFQRGMAFRLSQRFKAMKAERDQVKDPNSKRTGHDLVVVKNAVVTEAFAKLGMNLKGVRRGRANNNEHMAAGWEAGGKVAINPGVSQNGAAARISG